MCYYYEAMDLEIADKALTLILTLWGLYLTRLGVFPQKNLSK